MKYDTEELILAAHVRAIAVELRKSAAAKERKQHNVETGTADGYTALFAQSHPLEEFVPQALEQLKSLVDTTRIILNR